MLSLAGLLCMHTIELTLHVGEDLQEYLIAELVELDFEAFEQEADWLKACIPASRWDDVRREQVERWLQSHGIRAPLQERMIEPRNWNRLWEETIRPVVVEPFLVKPTWAAVPEGAEGLIPLEIDPKMSFGTGYHESTRLALRSIAPAIRPGDLVLDAGTGSGILAVAAAKLGAARVIAFDNDEWAVTNAVENLYLNGVADRVEFRAGSIETVPESGFDVIVANINRHIIIQMMPEFRFRIRPGGHLVLSGLLVSDRDAIVGAAASRDFRRISESTEGEWWAGVFAQGT
jgi:ribosomal protein L11 methyltransferase